jgi:hypothetical protein
VPSHPLGLVLYGSRLDILTHRSLMFDDEKGLEEPLIDFTRSNSHFEIREIQQTISSTNPNVLNARLFHAHDLEFMTGYIVSRNTSAIDNYKIQDRYIFNISHYYFVDPIAIFYN